MALYLHRRGLARRGYWYDGRVGFLALPVRAVATMRDLITPLYPFYLWLLFIHGGAVWLLAVLASQTAIMAAQLLVLSPVLQSRQGLSYWRMLPFFTLVYGPLLLSVRFVGTWAGLRHVWLLRQKEDRLEHAGLDLPALESVALAHPSLAPVLEPSA
jgi:hypothetical protein